MLKGEVNEKKISRPIVTLAITGITLGICVMILSVVIATGFQNQIRDKVVGFGSHIQITQEHGNYSFESSPMSREQEFISSLKSDSRVNHIQEFAFKPAIIQVKDAQEINGKEIRDIMGVVFKGIGGDFDSRFFKQYLQEGKIPLFSEAGNNDSILVSRYISNKLRLKVGDKVSAFFIKKEGPKPKNLVVGGVFDTGLEDFDKQFCYLDIGQIKKVNDWGIKTGLHLLEDGNFGFPIVEAITGGGSGNYEYSWNGGSFSPSDKIPLCWNRDTSVKVVVRDKSNEFADFSDSSILFLSASEPMCQTQFGSAEIEVLSNDTLLFSFGGPKVKTHLKEGKGTYNRYTGGYEVLLNNFSDLTHIDDIILEHVGYEFRAKSIVERNPEIFNWLKMLDTNVYIIIALMILVAVINMTAALLVLILEKTSMIGILKALGSSNWLVRKVFLWNGAYLILRGMFFGNLLAFVIIGLQLQFEFLKLPQANYYVSVVPMEVDLFSVILINLGAFLVSVIALLAPSYFITKITPVKAIKYV